MEYESYLEGLREPAGLSGPHCWSWVVRLPVEAIVMFPEPGGGRGPEGCELPFPSFAGSIDGYW